MVSGLWVQVMEVAGKVYVHNANGTPSMWTLKLDGWAVTSLLILNDGKWVVGKSYGNSDKVYVHNADGTPYTDFKVDGWAVIPLLLLNDGKWVVGTSEGNSLCSQCR